MNIKGPTKEKGPTEIKGPREVNFEHGGGQKNIFTRSAREFIYCSPTFKMMAPPLNVLH